MATTSEVLSSERITISDTSKHDSGPVVTASDGLRAVIPPEPAPLETSVADPRRPFPSPPRPSDISSVVAVIAAPSQAGIGGPSHN
jgi:hypothetical protein